MTYYYSLSSGQTCWELPSWAILRAAGRDSICPPRPSVGRAGSRKSSRASSRAASIVGDEQSVNADELAAIRLSALESAAAEQVIDEHAAADAEAEAEGPQPVQLQELMHEMLGWLSETKTLYQQARTEMFTLRVDQMGGLKQASEALGALAEKKSEGATGVGTPRR